MLRLILVFWLFFPLAIHSAQEQSLQSPARLDLGSRPLTQVETRVLLAPGTAVTVRFSVDVDRRGQMREVQLEDTGGASRLLLLDLKRRLKLARIRPASVGERRVPVRLGVMAVYASQGRFAKVSWVQNQGYEHPNWGLDYVGPQMLGGARRVDSLMSRRTPHQRRAKALVSFNVDSAGKTSGFLVLRSYPDRQLGVALADVLAATLFVPASHQGEFINSRMLFRYEPKSNRLNGKLY